ncbi:hypothetical protein ScPMuIL_005434 [Solemya velum]
MSQSTKRQLPGDGETGDLEGGPAVKVSRRSIDSNGKEVSSAESPASCDSKSSTISTTVKDVTISNGNIRQKLNQFGDYDDVTNMSVDDWEFRWGKGQTQFHMNKVHPMLAKYLDKLTDGKDKQRIFVPLCGKTLDLKWLSDKGHSVVGCEVVATACQQFFEENDIEYTTETLPAADAVLYKAKDGRPLEIYCCDFFKITSDVIGEFDCIWDRGSLVALGVTLRQKYSDVIHPLLKTGGRYILDCFLVDNHVFGGPPFNCSEEDVNKYLGDKFQIEKLEKKDVFSKWQEEWGVSYFFEEVYLLTH